MKIINKIKEEFKQKDICVFSFQDEKIIADSKTDSIVLKLNQAGENKTLESVNSKVKIEQSAKPTEEELAAFISFAIEKKKPEKPRYPIAGEHQAFSLSIDTTAKAMTKGQSQEIVLFLEQQIAGNYLINLDIAKHNNVNLYIFFAGTTKQARYFDIKVGEKTKVNIVNIVISPEDNRLETDNVLMQAVHLLQDSYCRQSTVNFETSFYADLKVFLEAEKAAVDIDVANLTGEKFKQYFHTEVVHHKGDTTSNIFHHGVVGKQGYSEFVGRGTIIKGSAGADCQQESRFLTLDKDAEAHSYPLLLIDEFDVKAGHASSVGQIDEDAVFYMQSRGLPKDIAQKMLMVSFLTQVLDHIENEVIKQLLVESLVKKVT